MANAGARDPDHATPPGSPPDTPSPTPQAFLWPPRTPADPPVTPWRTAGPRGEHGPADPHRPWLEQAERHWLGRTSETLISRARARAWAPDQPGSYCARCGSRTGLYETGAEGDPADDGCGACQHRRLPWSRVLRLGDYAGLLRRAVHELKFHRWRPVGVELGTLLGAALAAELTRTGTPREACILTPIPAPWWRRLARGIDHTLVLARAASAVCGAPIHRGLTRRWRPSQLAVTPAERRANVRGSFRARGSLPAGVRVVIVIDDVRTTGATMMEASRTLRRGWGREFEVWTGLVAVTRTRREPLAWSDPGTGAPAPGGRGSGGAGVGVPGPAADGG